MNARFFLDTNIFVYAEGGTPGAKQQTAQQLIERALATRDGVISFQVVQEFLNVATRRFREPMSSADAGFYLTAVLSRLLTGQASVGLYQGALQLNERYRLSWYDAIIVAAALEARCLTLYSEDLQHGQRFGDLTVINPF